MYYYTCIHRIKENYVVYDTNFEKLIILLCFLDRLVKNYIIICIYKYN